MTTTKPAISPVEETNARWIQSPIDRIARTWIFQTILRHLDTFLWILEKSAEWGLPRNEGGTEESMKTDLVRPLPWILFLPTLLFLRMLKAGLNIIALILGFPGVSSILIVRFAQKSRYRLASIGNTNRSAEKMRFKRDTQVTTSGRKSATGSIVNIPEERQREEDTLANKSDVSTGTKCGRDDQLVPELSHNSHDVNATECNETIKGAGERSCEKEINYDGRNEDEEATEESDVEEDESVDEEEEEDEDEEEEKSDEEKQKKHEGKGSKGEHHKVECDQVKSKSEYDEEENSKVECDKAECDLIEQPGNFNSEDNSSEKTLALSQDSDVHFFSPVESSASRSRSSSNSSVSNDSPRQSVLFSSTSSIQNI